MIRSDEAMVLLLDKLVQKMEEVKKEQIETKNELANQRQILNEQTPEGIVDPMDVHVTTENKVVTPPLGKKWFSVSVVSDGPDAVYIVVNSEKSNTNPYPLYKGETFETDFGCPKIHDLLMHCETGTANLRVRGVR